MRFYWYSPGIVIAFIGAVLMIGTIMFGVAFTPWPQDGPKWTERCVVVGFVLGLLGCAYLLIGVIAQVIYALLRDTA